MFIPVPALAGAPSSGALSGEESNFSTRLSAMLPGGVRGRGFGRGAPPVGTPVGAPDPAPLTSPSREEPSVAANHALPPEFLDYVEAMGQNIAFLREQLGEVRGELSALNGRGSDSQRVFDVLHHELNDYKRDFIYEHMKPLLRPLLFLYDSIDGFDQEMKLYEDVQEGQTLAPDALQGAKVRQNIGFLRDQLVQALGVCDVEPLPLPSGSFDPKSQKAIDTIAVNPELDGTIQNVVRIGWTMHGHVLRPAEVVLGKANQNQLKSDSNGEQSL
jgi:molecular chaperone GrpE